MNRFIIEISAAVALTLAAIIASATGVSASDVMVNGAFARASATPAAKSAAAYVTVMNHSASPDRLIGVSSEVSSLAAIHTTVMSGDVMKMEPAGILDLPAGGVIEMKPGGLHIMLTGLSAPLKKGDTLVLTLSFEKAGDIRIEVPVGGVAEGGHDHDMMSSGG